MSTIEGSGLTSTIQVGWIQIAQVIGRLAQTNQHGVLECFPNTTERQAQTHRTPSANPPNAKRKPTERQAQTH